MEGLYFIAVVPPADIRNEITAIKEDIKIRFGSGHALRSPPHITLHMPFRWKDKRRAELSAALKNVGNSTTPFEVQLKNYNCFKPRVIYIDVMDNPQLELLHKEVIQAMKRLHILNAEYKNKPFRPHMTVAFRDLRKSAFFEAWRFFKDQKINYQFRAQALTLLRHDGRKWNIDENFSFA